LLKSKRSGKAPKLIKSEKAEAQQDLRTAQKPGGKAMPVEQGTQI